MKDNRYWAWIKANIAIDSHDPDIKQKAFDDIFDFGMCVIKRKTRSHYKLTCIYLNGMNITIDKQKHCDYFVSIMTGNKRVDLITDNLTDMGEILTKITE